MKKFKKLNLKTKYIDIDGTKSQGKAYLQVVDFEDKFEKFGRHYWLLMESVGKEGGSFDGMIPLNKDTVKKMSKFFNKLLKQYD